MKLNKFYLIKEEQSLTEAHKQLIKKNHYSKSYRSMQQKYIFGLYDLNDNLIGSAVFGNPMNYKLMKRKFLELRKFCLIDSAPHNSESFFLGGCLRIIRRKNTYNKVVTFADPNRKHKGTIYLATNFKFDGQEVNTNPRIVRYKRKTIHMRQVYQKINGEYTKNAIEIQNLIKTKQAKVIKQKHKLRFVYDFT